MVKLEFQPLIETIKEEWEGNMELEFFIVSPNAHAYLASPAVVAASATKGYITGPFDGEFPPAPHYHVLSHEKSPSKVSVLPQLIEGFIPSLKGEVLFCDADNMNTDGIYPGKYTYQDDMTPSMMAQVAMENYDTTFTSIHQKV